MQIEHSKSHPALNVIRGAPVGYFETRYTDKQKYEVVYLSSQSGCNQGCRFCHLTTSGQTASVNANPAELIAQAKIGLERCKGSETNVVHFNYMARGEPLLNPHLNSSTLLHISTEALKAGFHPKHLVSTIFPKRFALRYSLQERFPTYQPEIYWSLYTVDETKRKQFMPAAANLEITRQALKNWQEYSRKILKIHFSIVPGLNDDEASIANICRFVIWSELRVDFNLVEYNPPDGETYPNLDTYYVKDLISEMARGSRVKVIPRIGPDAHVSCGMFFEG